MAPAPTFLKSAGHALRGSRLPLFMLLVTVLGVGAVSPGALLIVAIDVISVALSLGPFVLGGTILVRFLNPGEMLLRWRVLLSCALGLGGLSLGTLHCGILGLLLRPVWVAAAVVCAVAGVLQLRNARSASSDVNDAANRGEPYRLQWLLIVPFIVLSLLAAANAPGLIWSEEGFGYDVLEYHLQLPKEYRLAGSIDFLPHNVYANFPANVEMLYLLTMVLHNGDVELGTACNMVHLLLGLLAMFAAYVTGSEWSSRAGTVAGVALGTTHWLTYLSGLAYVENGMLFFGIVSAACVIRAGRVARISDRAPRVKRWLLAGGLLSGLASGCKYTAVPMIALPLVLWVVLFSFLSRPRSASASTEKRKRSAIGASAITHVAGNCIVFLLGAFITFGPWLVKNAVLTGNPVFPLANELFVAYPEGWSADAQQRWSAGHAPAPDERSVAARLWAAWRMIPGDSLQRFGPAMLLLPVVGLLWRRWQSVDAALVLMLAVQLLVWITATHLYARFAVVMLIPLALLVGRSALVAMPARLAVVSAVLTLGAVWNSAFAIRLHAAESAGAAPADVFTEGLVPGFEYYGYVNGVLAKDSRVLLVGEARAFYFERPVDYWITFNESPFVHAVRTADSPAAITAWLQSEGYTHVLVHWQEMARLRKSRYGFPDEVNDELFSALSRAGLRVAMEFEHPHGDGRYVTIYAVVGANDD